MLVCNEMLRIYFSNFDVSFLLFYPCGRNLSDLAIFIYLLVNLQIRWVIALGMTSKFRFMHLPLKQNRKRVFSLYLKESFQFIPKRDFSVFTSWLNYILSCFKFLYHFSDEMILLHLQHWDLLSLLIFLLVCFSELVQRVFGKYVGWASILMFCVFLFCSN